MKSPLLQKYSFVLLKIGGQEEKFEKNNLKSNFGSLATFESIMSSWLLIFSSESQMNNKFRFFV